MCVLSFIMCKTLQQSKNEPVVHNGKEKEKDGMEGGDFSNVIMQYFFFFFSFTEGVLKCERIECELGKLNIKAS